MYAELSTNLFCAFMLYLEEDFCFSEIATSHKSVQVDALATRPDVRLLLDFSLRRPAGSGGFDRLPDQGLLSKPHGRPGFSSYPSRCWAEEYKPLSPGRLHLPIIPLCRLTVYAQVLWAAAVS